MTAKKTPSRAELSDQKLAFVRGLLEVRTPLGEIKATFGKKFNCNPRSAERFITLAYELMRLDTDKTPEDHKSDAYQFYSKIVGDASEKTVDRIRAQERLDKILGLEAEIKISTNGNTSVTIQPQLSREEEQAAVEAVLNGTEAAHAATATGD